MRFIPPKSKRLILIGGGHTHALVLRMLAMKPNSDILVTLVNPSAKAPYTGMLPGYVAGHYSKQDVEIDLVKLTRSTQTQFLLDETININFQEKTVSLKNRGNIGYDIASINIGITSELPNIEGFKNLGHGAKPLGKFATGWEEFLSRSIGLEKTNNIAVIGGGVAGIELALSMARSARELLSGLTQVFVIEQNSEILKGTSEKTKQTLQKHLNKSGVKVLVNSVIKKITPNEVQLENGTIVPSNFTVGAAGATPQPWITQTGLDCQDGFIKVDAQLRSLSDASIFACGDCAHFTPEPLPKAGVFAVRQAPILLKNIRASLQGEPLSPYKPQKSYLKLISTGEKSAVSDKIGVTLDGPLVWRLKDHIDRKFMTQFSKLPTMGTEKKDTTAIATSKELDEKYANLCGGCGAKMSGQQLIETLCKQPASQRSDVLKATGDDAAVLKYGDQFQVFSTDHLRAFTNDPWLMGKIAAIHALGDIWAMGAKPQAVLSSVILPPMADHLHANMLDELLRGATEIFDAAGADLVGGHTSVGSELTIGFSITGLSDTHPIQNSGAKSGDRLILTKPIGIGTILAAEMRRLADGYDVQEAYKIMSSTSQYASEKLSPFANAMTDVTGFGLAGHLDQMMRNSNTKAVLNMEQIPLIKAAVGYAENGVKSSLWTANRSALSSWTHADTGKNALLFDPQTAGGLLAAVPNDKAPDLLKELLDAGETAQIIGHVEDGPSGISLI